MLYGLIGKYYPTLAAGKEYRPITDQEVKLTSVYTIATLAPLHNTVRVESWSGIFEQLAGRGRAE